MEYRDAKSQIGDWLKMFYGLPFLPPEWVLDGYVILNSCCPNDPRALDFSKYILDNYVLLCSFPPEMWAAAPTSTDPKTTNGAESFNGHFRKNFSSAHPNIHIFSEELKKVQSESYVNMRSVTNPAKSDAKQLQKLEYLVERFRVLQSEHELKGFITAETMKTYLKKAGCKFLAVSF